MKPYLNVAIAEQSQVGEARRQAARLATELGFDAVAAGRVALVVTELAANLARHARGGRLLLGRVDVDSEAALEVLSLDRGPGMADVGRCLVDGYSSASTPGTGLGAVRRLSNEFSVYSELDQGTVIVARVRASSGPPAAAPTRAAGADGFALAGICLAAPGETESGDAWAVRIEGDKARVVLADGLGHGPVAAEAAAAAVEIFERDDGSPGEVLARAHERLRSTRGAAAAVVELDASAGTVGFAGVGNVAGRLISGVADRTLLSQHGTLGVQVRRIADLAYDWDEHAFLILHSDGITSRWGLGESAGLLGCDPAVIAGWLMRDHSRGRDDATVVVVRRAQAER